MRCGDVYGFDSDQADNHYRKYKLHVCVCIRANLFLFINSSGNRDSIMPITAGDWPEMRRPSFISLDKVLVYRQEQLKGAKYQGRLSDDALERLMDEVGQAHLLTGQEIDDVIEGIRAYLFLGQ